MIKTETTLERLETFIFNENTTEHLHRYAIALEFSEGKVVLDIASGEGYGSNLIALCAQKVIGVDISNETIIHAKEKYKSSNLEFIVGSASSIPMPDSYFDLVVSFETIEHHSEHEKMMLEIKRVLKPGGKLIISSPDKKFYSDIPNHKNMFHIKELYFNEFKNLISQYFRYSYYFFQNNINGSIILPEEQVINQLDFYTGNYELIEKEKINPLYNICIACEEDFNYKILSFFDGKEVYKIAFQNKSKAMELEFNKKIEEIRNLYETSLSIKIGRAMTQPFRVLKQIFRR